MFPPPKRVGGGGHEKFYPVLRGSQKVLDPRFSHFVAPTPSPLLMTIPTERKLPLVFSL